MSVTKAAVLSHHAVSNKQVPELERISAVFQMRLSYVYKMPFEIAAVSALSSSER